MCLFAVWAGLNVPVGDGVWFCLVVVACCLKFAYYILMYVRILPNTGSYPELT